MDEDGRLARARDLVGLWRDTLSERMSGRGGHPRKVRAVRDGRSWRYVHPFRDVLGRWRTEPATIEDWRAWLEWKRCHTGQDQDRAA